MRNSKLILNRKNWLQSLKQLSNCNAAGEMLQYRRSFKVHKEG